MQSGAPLAVVIESEYKSGTLGEGASVPDFCVSLSGIIGRMIAYILFNKDTPAEGRAKELSDRLEREQVEVELLDADSPRGIQLTEHYDVMARPAVLLVSEDGTPHQIWQGEDSWPPPGEVAYLAHQ